MYKRQEEGDLAWLGFKIVYDADAAQRNTDNEVTKKYGDEGSADGEPLVFFCNDAKEIVASRPYSPRDTFQMKDVTRGPSMHNEQFEGLTWASVPLFDQVHVWLLGASDAASEVAALADPVSYTHLDVYKRQARGDPRCAPSLHCSEPRRSRPGRARTESWILLFIACARDDGLVRSFGWRWAGPCRMAVRFFAILVVQMCIRDSPEGGVRLHEDHVKRGK